MIRYSHAADAVPDQNWWIGRGRFYVQCRECDTEIFADDSAYYEPDVDFEDGQYYDRSTWLCAACGDRR